MKIERSRLWWLLGLIILAGEADKTWAADHRDAPLILGNEKIDLNDVYAFQSPANNQNVVFIMTVNPFIGMFAEDGTLDPNTLYSFLVDTDGDAREDINFSFRFSRANRLGQQKFALLTGSTTLATGLTGQTVAVQGGGQVLISIQDDPFFFDLGILMGGQGGNDTFAGANITAITLEIPRASLTTNSIGVWAITETATSQKDRMGRPAINTVLISSAKKDDFNQAKPVNDVTNFFDEVVGNIMAGFGRTQQDAETLANALLPDILTIDTSNANGFLNGRRLADDVIDAELQLLSGNGNATDGVPANDKAFLNVFPYLAAPHAP